MRRSDYQNQSRRRRRPVKQEEEIEKKSYEDNVTKEYDDYEIIEDVKSYKSSFEDKENEKQYKHFKSFDNKYKDDDKPYGFNIKSNESNNWHGKPYKEDSSDDWNSKSFYEKSKNNWHKNADYQESKNNWHPKSTNKPPENNWHKPFNEEPINNSKDADLVGTIEKLFKGDNDMVKEIISTLQDTGILENFREPLSLISRVYGHLLDGDDNQYGRPPMRAYNRANMRIKHMQRQDANKQLHSEMYSIILKQIKDMLVKNYGTKIKNNMPTLFDDDE